MTYSDDERLLLQTICRYFHELAQWPTLDYLDRTLTKEVESFDVLTVAANIVSSMYEGWYVPIRGWEPERTVPLTITALYTCYTEGLCPELKDDLDAFLHVVQFAVERYQNRTNDRPEVTADEMREHFGMSDLMLRKVFELVGRANLTSGSASRDTGPDQPIWWTFAVSRDVRQYRYVVTMYDYIQVHERIRAEQRRQMRGAAVPSTVAETGTADVTDTSGTEAATTTVSAQLRPISLFPLEPVTRNDYLCFVLMPFSEKLQPAYHKAIVRAATEVGLECVRADEINESGGIMQQVWQHLRMARVVVADLTEKNANVFYELGLAHTIGHDVILLTQDMAWVPFDLQQLRCIKYIQTEHGLKILSQALGLMFRTILEEPRP
jgi:hypothetical protein